MYKVWIITMYENTIFHVYQIITEIFFQICDSEKTKFLKITLLLLSVNLTIAEARRLDIFCHIL